MVNYYKLTCFWLLLLCATVRADAQNVEVLEEARAIGFVKLVQTGSADSLLAYMQENWIPEEPEHDRGTRWPQLVQTLIERHSELEIVGVTAERPHHLTIMTEDPSGIFLRFDFEFEPDPPHLILSMELKADRGAPRFDLPEIDLSAGTSIDQIAISLEAWFKALSESDKFSGTALVAWHGEPIFSTACGLANIRWNVPNNLDTRFDLGSINKSFTKIAIGQLLSQGKLTLDDVIAKYLPDYPNEQVGCQVTIRHLLNHTSGLGDIFTEEFFNSSKSLYRKSQDFFPLFVDQPLQFEPGEGQSYSNAGFMVLGAIIEKVSGEPYDEYVLHHIFEPSGMASSGFFSRDDPVANVATGYTLTGEGEDNIQRRSNVFILPIKGNSAGSAQSTVGDLLRFDTALREHHLLDPEYTAWYLGGNEPLPDSVQDVSHERATAAVGIAGGAPGVNSALESDGDLAVIVLSNYDPPIAESVASQLFRTLKKVLQETN